MERILVDTGFLIALGRAGDPLHRAARSWLEGCTMRLATVTGVVVEACHFLRLSRAGPSCNGWRTMAPRSSKCRPKPIRSYP